MAGDPTADLTRMTAARDHFSQEGYLQWDGLITAEEVAYLKDVYDKMLGGAYAEVAKHRYDLGEGDTSPKKAAGVEKITQIMWPSDILPALRDHPMRARALALARALYEDDCFEFDFDMLINKAPQVRGLPCEALKRLGSDGPPLASQSHLITRRARHSAD